MGLKVERILCPTDFSEISMGGIEYGLELAKVFSAELVCLHVVEPLISSTLMGHAMQLAAEIEMELEEQAQKKFEELRGQWDYSAVRFEIRRGKAHQEILELAEQEGVDLIVLGTHGRSGIAHFLLGSTAEKVIRRANCPVLSLRIAPEISQEGNRSAEEEKQPSE